MGARNNRTTSRVPACPGSCEQGCAGTSPIPLIRTGATIKTDAWRGYRNLTGYQHIARKQRKGHEGRDLPAIHLLFANFKRIIRGVHTHVSPQKLQRYLDLFEYRYNHRENLWAGFYNAAIHLTHVPPRRYRELKAAATAL